MILYTTRCSAFSILSRIRTESSAHLESNPTVFNIVKFEVHFCFPSTLLAQNSRKFFLFAESVTIPCIVNVGMLRMSMICWMLNQWSER